MRFILSFSLLGFAGLTAGAAFLGGDMANAASPECQTMSIQGSNGPRDVLMCKDANGRWYEASASAATPPPATSLNLANGALPAKARVTYQGQYTITVTKPMKKKRNPSIIDLMKGGDKSQQQGMVTLDLNIEGPSITGSMKATGGSSNMGVTGMMQNGVCTIYTADGRETYKGQCDARGFSATINSTGTGKDKVEGTFQASAMKVVDVALEQQQQAAAAKIAADKAKQEQARTAQEQALMRSRAEAGNVQGMIDLADAYFFGDEGFSYNYSEAAKWYEMAAKRGNPYGAGKVGVMYYNGSGVTQDRAKGHRYNLQCASTTDAEMGRTINRYTKEETDMIARCMDSVGNNYYSGIGTVRNETEGVRWFKACARRGRDSCIDWLNEHGETL